MPSARKQLNREIGRLGEDAAAQFLSKQGYRILQRNYSCKAGEIDIIAEHASQIVFVEVKTRSPRAWNTPMEAVDSDKQQRILKAAKYYLAGFREASPQRYDIVSVFINDENHIEELRLEQDAFSA